MDETAYLLDEGMYGRAGQSLPSGQLTVRTGVSADTSPDIGRPMLQEGLSASFVPSFERSYGRTRGSRPRDPGTSVHQLAWVRTLVQTCRGRDGEARAIHGW